ncbi:hypothetical protein CEXT_213281 [Caerostris extrusa]|uniref:Uncharacterized protein n=1 Tax=Caerostris extrusa TaxID=172846 RepID=A0AAV4Q4K2_CAEEX|nr:hypothetical protein CEXT_213281 [Caerostris extrusa]
MKTDFATHLPSLATSHRNLVPGAGLSGGSTLDLMFVSRKEKMQKIYGLSECNDQRSRSSGEKMSKKLRGCRCPLEVRLSTVSLQRRGGHREKNRRMSFWS